MKHLILILALGVGAASAGCVSEQADTADVEQTGTLNLNLEAAPGVTLNSVSYSITGNGFSKTGSIDVGDSPSISGTIGGIPAGSGYTITLTATSVEGGASFTGSAKFNVLANQTTSVTVHLKGSGASGDGSVSVIGSLNLGPVIDELTVAPLTAFVGSEITLSGVGTDPDEGPSPLSYSWSTTGGVIDDPAAANAILTSETPGSFTVELTVSDGELSDTQSTTVQFVSRDEAGTSGTGAEQPDPLALVTTAVAPNTAGVTSTVVQVPSGVEPDDTAVVFVLSTGSSAVVSSPEGFATTNLAAAQHSISFGRVGTKGSLSWTSATATTTGATAFFFRGSAIAVEVLATNQPSGSAFGLPASSKIPQAAFAEGYALFGIQLPVGNTPTISVAPEAPWQGPVTDGRQLFTWAQPYVSSSEAFLFPAASGTLSASAVKRQAQVFVSSAAP